MQIRGDFLIHLIIKICDKILLKFIIKYKRSKISKDIYIYKYILCCAIGSVAQLHLVTSIFSVYEELADLANGITTGKQEKERIL